MAAVASSRANTYDRVMETVYPLDDGFNCLLIIFSIGLYIATAQRASHAISVLTKSVAGLSIAKTFFTVMKCADGIQNIVRGKTFKDPAMKMVASTAFTVARIALCVFALQKIGLIKLGNHANWLSPLINAGFGAGTILYLMNAIHKRYFQTVTLTEAQKADLKRDMASGVLNSAAVPFELEVLNGDAPLALKIGVAVFAALAAAFDAYNGLRSHSAPAEAVASSNANVLQKSDSVAAAI